MLIDMHTHLWVQDGSRETAEENKRTILKTCENFQVDRIYLSSLGSYYPDEEEIRCLNRMTYDFMREYPELVRGYCYLNPRNPDTMEELRRGIEEYGMSGVKLWVATFCDDPLVNPIAEQCIRYGVPLLIHAFYKADGQLEFESLGENVENLANRYPEAKLIMAHLGANCYRELRPVRDCPNVWADFSGSIFHSDDLAYAKKLLGAKRLLFGTDMPGIAFHVSWGQWISADFTPEEREMVGWKNALELFEGGDKA